MDIPRKNLGLAGNGEISVVNLKCDTRLIGAFRKEPGIFPGWHMNKSPWLSVALDVDLATIQSIVGHADVDMTQHYLHVQESIRQDAIARFSKAFTSETTDPDKPTDGACKVLKFPKVG